MAIQNRRGDYNDYMPAKMLPGEFGITLEHDPRAVDGKGIHIAFAPGDDKTIMTFEDAEGMIEDATVIAIEGSVERATEEAKAWAHGNGFETVDTFDGDGTTESFTLKYTPTSIVSVRVGESVITSYTVSGNVITFTTAPVSGGANIIVTYDVTNSTDNAKYYKEQAASSASSASTYASNASSSASSAATQAGNAADSATAAAGSASAASGYASSASGYSSSASAQATEAANQRRDSEAWAVGKKDGIDVPSSESQYHNNSKYWAEQAATSAAILEEFAYYDPEDESIVFRSNEFVSYDVADESINISI